MGEGEATGDCEYFEISTLVCIEERDGFFDVMSKVVGRKKVESGRTGRRSK